MDMLCTRKALPDSIRDYPRSFVVIDIETNGLEDPRIIEISAAKYKDMQKVDELSMLVNPCAPISPAASAVNQITDDMVEGAPTWKEIEPEVYAFLGDYPLVGHNIESFDAPCLERHFGRSIDNLLIDTLTIARQLLPGNDGYRLGGLCEQLGLDAEPSHRAAADVDATFALYGWLLEHCDDATAYIRPKKAKTAKLPDYRYMMSKEDLHKCLNSLVGLLEGVKLDEKINRKEADELQNWTALHHHLLEVEPFTQIAERIDAVLEDGILEPEEAADIVWLCKQFLGAKTGELYFDEVTSNLQRLQGIIHGILADGVLSDQEITGLTEWLNDNDELAGRYPYDEIYSLLLAAKEDGVISDDERNMLKAFFSTFVDTRDSMYLNEPELARLREDYHIGGVCAVDPEIIFNGRVFCFTGESAKASRDEIAQIVTEHGGIFAKGLTRSTDYLVVGSEGNPCWSYSCYGRKIEKAMELRKKGHKVVIVNECDFWDALVE